MYQLEEMFFTQVKKAYIVTKTYRSLTKELFSEKYSDVKLRWPEQNRFLVALAAEDFCAIESVFLYKDC